MRDVKRIGLAAMFIAMGACSSSSDGGGTGAQVDASTFDGGHDAGVDSGAPVTTACTALFAYQQRCAADAYGSSDACLTGREQNCAATLAIYTPTFQAAIAACETSTLSCDDGPGACYDSKLAGVAPTTAQAKVRDDYCAGCSALANCATAFFTIDPNNGDGPGLQVLQITDAVAAQVDAQCTGGALLDAGDGSDCTQAFAGCAATVIEEALPNDPDACFPPGDDGGGATGDDGGDAAIVDASDGG